jgi:hypothetical protein
MVDLVVDDDGLVWTLIHVAHPDWAKAWEDAGISELGTGERRVSDLPGAYELYQARIEVLSTDLQSVLISEVAPGFVVDLLQGGYLARYSETDIGAPIVEVLEVRLGQRD